MEFELYHAIQDYYCRNQEIVCVFQGLDLTKFNMDESDNSVKEKDFVIISPVHKSIISIECKKTLKDQMSKSSACSQLKDTKARLESWFFADLHNLGWSFVPLVYCHTVADDSKPCETCQNYIITGNYFGFHVLNYRSKKFQGV